MNDLVPVSVLIPAKNQEKNLGRCLVVLYGWADEVVVADSQSSDRTVAIAKSYAATVVQFKYQGGWPKKRQAALDTYPFRNEWIFLLDSDEILLDPVKRAIAEVIAPVLNTQTLAREAYRVLKPDGILFVTTRSITACQRTCWSP